MQIKELLLGVPILIFILWVFSAPMPQERIGRLCQPIQWVGNIATSTTALSADNHTGAAVRWSDKLSYSCQYLVWRLIYQDDYNRAIAAGLIKPTSTLYSKPLTTPTSVSTTGMPADVPFEQHPASPTVGGSTPAQTQTKPKEEVQ